MELRKTPLYKQISKANGKMTNFSGWDMPLQYSSVIEEHKAVRDGIGLFDISHMGIIEILGSNPKDEIQHLFPTDLYSFGENQSCYTMLLNENGGIIDDLIIYDLGITKSQNHKLIIIVNASRTKKDLKWITDNINSKNITLTLEEKKALIAIQGDQSFELFQQWSRSEVNNLPRKGCCLVNKFCKDSKRIEKVFIAKTGYTGEIGLEVLLSKSLAVELWEFLIDQNIPPCGLGARDTLRIEAGLPLYGNELTEEKSPFNVKLGKIVNLESTHTFIGREALEKQTETDVDTELVGIKLKDKRIPRKDCKIFFQNEEIGIVTSGSWSPSLEVPIAMGFIKKEFSNIKQEIGIEIRGKLCTGIISKMPFYQKRPNIKC